MTSPATKVSSPHYQQHSPQSNFHQHQQQSLHHTTSSPKYSSRKAFKSKSLDHDLFMDDTNRYHGSSARITEWKFLYPTNAEQAAKPLHQELDGHMWAGRNFLNTGLMTRASSTFSLASSGCYTTISTTNYQEFKMEIVNQGKCLCGQYIRARLRRAGVLNRKVVQRLRSILEPSSAEVVYEVFPALNSMGEELERMHPRIYTNVARQLSRAPYGELEDSDTTRVLLSLVAKELFRTNITWGKIISIFAVCGALALDCVRQGHYDYLQFLMDGVTEIIEDDLAQWLVENGGWLGLQRHICPCGVGKYSLLGWLTLFVSISAGVYLIANIVKCIGCHLYSLLL